jgi:hypothetical protein
MASGSKESKWQLATSPASVNHSEELVRRPFELILDDPGFDQFSRRSPWRGDLPPGLSCIYGALAFELTSPADNASHDLNGENFMARIAHLRGPLSLLPAFLAAAGDRRRPSGGHGLVSKAQG